MKISIAISDEFNFFFYNSWFQFDFLFYFRFLIIFTSSLPKT